MENKMMQELIDSQAKLVKGYETLGKLPEVEIAETPKTEVYAEDKLRLYRYNRDTEATIKTPVLIVYALVNTYKMLDLQPDRSYVKNLLNLGFTFLLLIIYAYNPHNDEYGN